MSRTAQYWADRLRANRDRALERLAVAEHLGSGVLRRVLPLATALATVVLLASPAHSDETVTVGAPEQVLGPTVAVDSLYWSATDSSGRDWGYVSNTSLLRYQVAADGTLHHGTTVLQHGPGGSYDQCGLHPIGAVVKVNPHYWYTFYHGDKASPLDDHQCVYGNHRPRGSVYRMHTTDQGKTWIKDGRVLSQDHRLLSWNPDTSAVPSVATDDAGSPRLIFDHDYLYLIYRAWNYDLHEPTMALARASRASLGQPGAWQKWYGGSYSQPGLGGAQSAVSGLPDGARGVTWNTYLGSYIDVAVSAQGFQVWRSNGHDLTSWTPYGTFGEALPASGSWGADCTDGHLDDGSPSPEVRGYGASVGLNGSDRVTRRSFWVYYMDKPQGQCFDHRYLDRRKVTF